MPPHSPKARSLVQPHSMTDSYMVWCRIDIRYRECSTETVDLNRTTHVFCVVLHSPVSGVAILMPRRGRRQRAFPCSVSSASSCRGYLTLTRTQYPATVGNRENRKPL